MNECISIPLEDVFEMLRKNGKALRFLPEACITPELCREAVKSDSAALAFAP